MAWICVDSDGTELFTKRKKPHRNAHGYWADTQIIVGNNITDTVRYLIEMPAGTIERLLKRKMTWEDEPVEVMDNYNKLVSLNKDI